MKFSARLCGALLFVSTAAFGQTLPRPDHIILVFEENKQFSDIMGSANAPFINELAAKGASLSSMFAFHHPSQPNYIEFFAGTNMVTINGVEHIFCDDTCIKQPSSTPSLGGAFVNKGLTFTGFAEDLALAGPGKPLICQACQYRLKHAPWIDFTDSNQLSAGFDQFPSDFTKLPTFAMVIPNLLDDMHSTKGVTRCTTGIGSIPIEVRHGDNWLREHLAKYAEWAMTNNSLLIITWDESSQARREGKNDCRRFKPPKNHIPTIFVGQMVKTGFQSTVTYNHYDLLRTIEDMYGLDHLGNSATAKDITDIWQ